MDRGIATRQYSISSCPGSGYLDVTVRASVDGRVAPFLLDHLSAGDSIESSAPEGGFWYDPAPDGDDLVSVAGGSGITPFMSMIREFVRDRRPVRVSLIHGSRHLDDVIFAGELGEISRAHDNIRCALVMSEPPPGWKGRAGRIDGRLIQEATGGLKDRTVFVSGPDAMVDSRRGALRDLGVQPDRIRLERFGPIR